jgi:predicted MFS family arabinose efflux permease
LPEAATVAYLVVGVAVMIGLAVVFVRDRPVDGVTAARQAQVLIFAFLLVLSPNYPWYFLALVPLGCLAPWLPARVLTLLAIILYAAPPLDVDGRAVLVQSLLHASVMAALVVDLYNRHPVAAGLPANPRDGP